VLLARTSAFLESVFGGESRGVVEELVCGSVGGAPSQERGLVGDAGFLILESGGSLADASSVLICFSLS